MTAVWYHTVVTVPPSAPSPHADADADARPRLLGCARQLVCPGCPLGDRDYEMTVEVKGAQVAEALRSYPGLAPILHPVHAASKVHAYRLRAKLVADGNELGLYESGGHTVIDLEDCPVLAPDLSRAARATRKLLPLPIDGADFRVSSRGVMLTLWTSEPSERPRLVRAAEALTRTGAAESVAISVRPADSKRLVAGTPEVISGPRELPHRFHSSAPYAYATHGSFVQAHAEQAFYVHRAIAEKIAARRGQLRGVSVLELFAGNGALALFLSRQGARVTAVEAFAPGIALAQRAAREQGLGLEAHAHTAERFVGSALRAAQRFDVVLVNPPRRGLSPEVRSALPRLTNWLLAYVSCNPDTLARDLSHLRELGLAVREVTPLDMIPWSDAVEALCFLEPGDPTPPQIVFEDEQLVCVEKPGHLPLWAPAVQPSLMARLRARANGTLGAAEAVLTAETHQPGASGLYLFGVTSLSRSAALASEGAVSARHLLAARGICRTQGRIARSLAGSRSAPRPVTRYRRLRVVGGHSLLEVVAEPGSELSICQHFAGIGHPVLGDARFGDPRSNQHALHRHGLDRIFFHTSELSFRSPTGVAQRVQSELPPDLRAVLASLQRSEQPAGERR